MKRRQLFEFEDQNWFPNSTRVALTKLIVVLLKGLGTDKVLAKKLSSILSETNNHSIIDLGSGAGGMMPFVHRNLINSGKHEKLTTNLTDLYPNPEAIKNIKSMSLNGLNYLDTPIDARNLMNGPIGIRTMINSFHHMNPNEAKNIISSAEESGQPLFVYEMAENKIPFLIWMLALPLSMVIMIIMVLFMTPFVKPLTFNQLFFTYIIPIIPIAYAWDGQASMPRIYSMSDIDELLKEASTSKYLWEKGPIMNDKGKQQGYFIYGKPNN